MGIEAFAAAKPRPLWWDAVDVGPTRASLTQDIDVDVLIVGAGFTGLWTAFFLQEADPALSIAVAERDHVGFGASGRNGGFCYDGFAAGPQRIEDMSDADTARRWAAALRDSVGVVGDITKNHGIDCDYTLSGTVEFCRNGGQLTRARHDVALSHHYGWTADDVRMLSAEEALEIGRAAGVSGAMWSRLTASIHPAKLVHGLAAVVESRGTTIYEQSPVAAVEAGRATIAGHTVTAGLIVRATEGYTPELPGHKRRLAPLYSLMIATEPLSDRHWDEIGLAGRESFGDMRHLVVYGQRTADGRIAFGGRGAPYDFGSKVRRNADFDETAFMPVRAALLEIFPQLQDVAISHRWGGVLGVSRQWMPTVGFDREAQFAWSGGYVGSGVAATNLAGRTLAALITNTDDAGLIRFPWVNHRVRQWEPEPFRWLGINAALGVMSRADRVEARTDKPAKSADLLWRLVGL